MLSPPDCTQDGQFVFTVRRRDAEPPLDLSGVRVEGHEECAPLVTTPEALVFKFGVTECGARRDDYGQVLRFQVELVAVPGVSRLEYGPVSRDSPYRLLIECQYRQSVLVQAGLTALDPTPPKPASALGQVRVEMRIAKDSSFSSFFPADRLPLSLPLREPLFVEVRVRDPPDPRISLRIRDCFAYPASRHSLWVLLYDG
ncbi:ZP4 protein, partial [Atractosteus spatula]|nr:ZP4 protein [Atractosteus spatula]